jgi:4-hydroxythreonine-4-phosphate dehydrogenase
VTPRLALTLGDPSGIGPEVVLGALADVRTRRFFTPLLVGSLAVLEQHAARLGVEGARFVAVARPDETVPEGALAVLDVTDGAAFGVPWGQATEAGGRVSMESVARAVDLCRSGEVAGMVTAPISKEAIAKAGHDTPGHTEFIARRCGMDDALMLLVADALRVALVTVHVPLRRVPELITVEAILAKRRALEGALRQDFGVDRPRVAVLGLNPHAGDGGVLGSEETEIVAPAIAQACDAGMLSFGPFPADGFFAGAQATAYDAVLALYHDQGLGPFKALAFEKGVNVTCGLPVVRTSPDHGTAYGIAGQGRADATSFREACYLAAGIARRRGVVDLEGLRDH